MIEIKALTKTFHTRTGTLTALDNINLSIHDGEIFGIIGLSGAGKSTLVRCINLLERPDAGEVWLDGRDLMKLSNRELLEVRRGIGMIFQSYNLLEQRTVLRNVLFPLEISHTPRDKARERAKELLELVGLADKADAYPSQLSGGQKQRVAIAGIIAMQPRCILLDEPTAMLDPRGRQEVMRVLRQLNREKGITVVLITHYMEEAAACDRVIVMDDGHVLMDDVPRKVFSHVAELRQVGLDVPQTTELMTILKEAGLPVQADIIDEQECIEALEALLTR